MTPPIEGRIEYPPEVRFTSNGKRIAVFNIVTSYGVSHRCEAWDDLAANIYAMKLTDTDDVRVNAKMKTREWVSRDGETHTSVYYTVYTLRKLNL